MMSNGTSSCKGSRAEVEAANFDLGRRGRWPGFERYVFEKP